MKYGPRAIVTGATSGIGRAFAIALAQRGLNLVLVGRDATRMKDVITEITQSGVEVRPVMVDLADSKNVELVKVECRDLEIGLFVAAAGFGTAGNFIATDLDAELELIRVNIEALANLTHYFARKFWAQQRGGIVLLSSIVAFQGVPRSANYAASKAYVQTLGEALAIELKPYVDVMTVAPGPVASGFEARSGMELGSAMAPEAVVEPVLRNLGRTNHVVPGVLSKILTYSLRTAPRFLKIRIMRAVMAGFTKKLK